MSKVRLPAFPIGFEWLNCPTPLRREDLAGRVSVLDFWTYCCVNCLHMLPVLHDLEQRFAGRALQVVGIHSAKFHAEKEAANVRMALQRHGIQHPVLLDEGHAVWEAFAIRAWPTLVIVDAAGYVRETLSGEIPLAELSAKVERYLAEGAAAGDLVQNPTPLGRADAAVDSALRFPGKILVAGERVYIADSGHHRILACDLSGRLEKIYGLGSPGDVDGTADIAALCEPQGMEVMGEELFVADRANHKIRAIDIRDGEIRTVAGNGEPALDLKGFSPERPTEIPLRSPWDLCAIGPNLVVAMAGSHQLWVYQEEGPHAAMGPWAGTGAEGHVDGPLHEASFAQPSGLAFNGSHLLVVDSETSSLRAVDLDGMRVMSVVGKDLFDFGDVDGPFEQVLLQHPLGVAASGGTLWIADSYNNKIKEVSLGEQKVRTALGNGDRVNLCEPGGLDLLGEELLIADTNNHRILRGNPATGALEEWEIQGL